METGGPSECRQDQHSRHTTGETEIKAPRERSYDRRRPKPQCTETKEPQEGVAQRQSACSGYGCCERQIGVNGFAARVQFREEPRGPVFPREIKECTQDCVTARIEPRRLGNRLEDAAFPKHHKS